MKNYGPAFNFKRKAIVHFYTSSLDKLLQARLLFAWRGYDLRHYRGRYEPYEEKYGGNTRELLEHSIKYVTEEFGLRSIFFVEDTSIRIDCLSGNSDFPGMEAKEWFKSTTFQELEEQIEIHGGNRKAIVKSDIGLSLPTLPRPIFFHGETSGIIASSPPKFERSVQHPWLTPTTFNGWFIPDGAQKRLGEMEYEESLNFDFRIKALNELVDRIEELNSSLNLPPQYYVAGSKVVQNQSQISLFEAVGVHTKLVVAVIGKKCAGKSTLGQQWAKSEDVLFLEASRLLLTLADGKGRKLNDNDAALEFLDEFGLGQVGIEASRIIEEEGKRINVVTGLRTLEELIALITAFPDLLIICVEADKRLRFERLIARARNNEKDAIKNQKFEELDQSQLAFGVIHVARELAHQVIINEGSLPEYLSRIDDEILRNLRGDLALQEFMGPKFFGNSELYRCLNALSRLSRISTCEEISVTTGEIGEPVRRYNTNRALKEVPLFATRHEPKSNRRLSYEITDQGRIFVQLINLLKASRESKEF